MGIRIGDDGDLVPMRRLIVVVGMNREGKIARAPAIVGGGCSADLAVKVSTALALGGNGVISFGIGGGLDPALRPGHLVIGKAVTTVGDRLAADAAWVERLAAHLPDAIVADIAGGDRMIVTAAEKTRLRQVTGAAVADMESHIVAELAARAGVPFAVLRAVADPASHALPTSARIGLKANGDPDVRAVIFNLARRPGELLALIRTARQAAAAFRALADARHLLGPRLGCPYVAQHLVDVP
ncbi:MAG: hypothetical protein ABI376_08030 [Caulobacteraceae bacterium]